MVHPSRGPDLTKPDSMYQVHALLGSAQPGGTLLAWSLSVPSLAAEPPSVLSRKRPAAPALHEGLGKGASVGGYGL